MRHLQILNAKALLFYSNLEQQLAYILAQLANAIQGI